MLLLNLSECLVKLICQVLCVQSKQLIVMSTVSLLKSGNMLFTSFWLVIGSVKLARKNMHSDLTSKLNRYVFLIGYLNTVSFNILLLKEESVFCFLIDIHVFLYMRQIIIFIMYLYSCLQIIFFILDYYLEIKVNSYQDFFKQ